MSICSLTILVLSKNRIKYVYDFYHQYQGDRFSGHFWIWSSDYETNVCYSLAELFCVINLYCVKHEIVRQLGVTNTNTCTLVYISNWILACHNQYIVKRTQDCKIHYKSSSFCKFIHSSKWYNPKWRKGFKKKKGWFWIP